MPELAVLTGDIVRSRRLSADALDAVFQAMSKAAERLGDGTGQAAYFTRTRGDGWQMLAQPAFALRAVFVMRAAVRSAGKGLETRLALSIGPVLVRGRDLSDADGPGLVTSGQRLDGMGVTERIAFEDVPLSLQLGLTLAEPASTRWTPRQAEIALAALALPARHKVTIATYFDISQQALQKFWGSAQLEPILNACLLCEVTQ